MANKPAIPLDAQAPAPLTAVESAISQKDTDNASWALLKLHLHNLRYMKAGTKDYTMALTAASRLVIDIKRSQPISDSNKEQLLEEVMRYMNQGD